MYPSRPLRARPPVLCAVHVHAEVALLVHQNLGQPSPKSSRCIREAEEGERHELKRLQFMMREAVQRESPRPLVLDTDGGGCSGNWLVCAKLEVHRPPRGARNINRSTRTVVGQAGDASQLEREIGRVENGLCKGTNLHGSPSAPCFRRALTSTRPTSRPSAGTPCPHR